jgi:hypothetical protein
MLPLLVRQPVLSLVPAAERLVPWSTARIVEEGGTHARDELGPPSCMLTGRDVVIETHACDV